jgi:hypothetical protein
VPNFVARLGGPRLFKTERALTGSICPGAGHGLGPRTVKGHALRFVAVGRTMKLGWRSMGSCVIEATFRSQEGPPVLFRGRRRSRGSRHSTTQPVRSIRKEVKDDQEEAPREG